MKGKDADDGSAELMNMAKTCLTRHFQRARGNAHGLPRASEQQGARHRIGDVVVRAWRVIDGVSAAAAPEHSLCHPM